MYKYLILLLTVVPCCIVSGQSPGLVIQTGITAAFSKDKKVTKEGEGHYGWMVGADARILEGNLYFVIGGQYTELNLVSIPKKEFFNKDWKLLLLRGGFGFNILTISDNLAIRSKLLGSINYIVDAPDEGLKIDGYRDINDSYLGAVTGLGVTIGAFDVDLEYQYGILNAYKLQKESTFTHWTFMAGFHF